MEPETQQLTDTQIRICADAQQFLICTSKQLQARMVSYPWRDYLEVIKMPQINENIRLACCSVLKTLVYNKKFVQNPLLLFNTLMDIYINMDHSSWMSRKIEGAMQMILETLMSSYFKEQQKWDISKQLLQKLANNPPNSKKLLRSILLVVNIMESATVNNEVLVGEMLVFIEKVLNSDLGEIKIVLIQEAIKVIDQVLTMIDEDEDEENEAEKFMMGYETGQKTLQKIIDASYQNYSSIITGNRDLDRIKSQTLLLYKRIWIFSPPPHLFKMCVQTLINTHDNLHDEQAQIMESVVKMIERSIGKQIFHQYLHSNTQPIVISLLVLLKPQESYLQLIAHDADYFIQINEDFTMEQNQQLLQTSVGSLISNLCMSIDGYLSFIGSMCLMILKCWDGSIADLEGGQSYIDTISEIWKCEIQEKLGTCVWLLSAISDQIEKRKDLYNPLMHILYTINPYFKLESCTLHPYIICRFMALYAFYSYRTCMNIFLPYKQLMPAYDLQLQSSYKILQKYANRRVGVPEYLLEIAPVIILSDHLTPTLENAIFNSPQLLPVVQFPILEKLSLWMQESYEKQNTLTCNKISNLIVHLLEHFKISEDAQQNESFQNSVFSYLQGTYRLLLKKQGNPLQQSAVQIIKSHITKFSPVISKFPEKIKYFFHIGEVVTQRNGYTLNSCLDVFVSILDLLPYQWVFELADKCTEWLLKLEREDDKWQCLYLLEFCVLRIGKLVGKLPNFNLQIILNTLQDIQSQSLFNQVSMFLFSIISVNPNNQQLNQYLSTKPLPNNLCPLLNKPLCLYLINRLKCIDSHPQKISQIIEKILNCFVIQQNIAKQIKSYESKVFAFSFKSDEVAMNSFQKLRYLKHPLSSQNIDLYQEFRNFWSGFQYRAEYTLVCGPQINKQINDILNKKIVNHAPRKIYRVPKSLNL